MTTFFETVKWMAEQGIENIPNGGMMDKIMEYERSFTDVKNTVVLLYNHIQKVADEPHNKMGDSNWVRSRLNLWIDAGMNGGGIRVEDVEDDGDEELVVSIQFTNGLVDVKVPEVARTVNGILVMKILKSEDMEEDIWISTRQHGEVNPRHLEEALIEWSNLQERCSEIENTLLPKGFRALL